MTNDLDQATPEDSQPLEQAPLCAGAPFSDAELLAADLHYLASQHQRDERKVAEAMDLERAYVARRGWAL
jgi:hypothetical protein